MRPLLLITRCHGNLSLREEECNSQAICRAARGLPANLAIWPYVATFPAGIALIRAFTLREKELANFHSSQQREQNKDSQTVINVTANQAILIITYIEETEKGNRNFSLIVGAGDLVATISQSIFLPC